MPRKPTFATTLARLLTEAGRSAYWLSQQTGIPQQTLSRLLAGSPPKWETVRKIADALDVSTEVFRR